MSTLEERFWAKVDVRGPDDCWEWKASKNSWGYGQISNDGTMLKAHRVAYELHIGEIPEGLCVCHTCDNPGCGNPKHLFLGTHADNNADRASKGRSARGVKNPAAKLTEEQVKEILKLARTTKLRQREIGEMFGVSQQTICKIIISKTWAHISEDRLSEARHEG